MTLEKLIAKRLGPLLLAVLAIGLAAAFYGSHRETTTSERPRVRGQSNRPSEASDRKIVEPAVHPRAFPSDSLKFSQKKYTYLRQHYRSPSLQAYGTPPASYLKLLEKLMEMGVVGNRGLLPIVNAVIHGDSAGIANRLDAGLNPNSMVFRGYPYNSNVSLLCIAIEAGQRDVINELLAHGASPNPPRMIDDAGRPYNIEAPLVVAAEYGEDDVVTKLLKLGADPNQHHGLSSDNYSALAQAVYSNNISTAYLLLTHGADTSAILGPGNSIPAFLRDRGERQAAFRDLLTEYASR